MHLFIVYRILETVQHPQSVATGHISTSGKVNICCVYIKTCVLSRIFLSTEFYDFKHSCTIILIKAFSVISCNKYIKDHQIPTQTPNICLLTHT